MDQKEVIKGGNRYGGTVKQASHSLSTLDTDFEQFQSVKAEMVVLGVPNKHNYLCFFLSNYELGQKSVLNYSFTNHEEFLLSSRQSSISKNFEELVDF